MPIKSDTFKKYKQNANTLIETGSHAGNGIMEGMRAGFDKIYSIELSGYFYNLCQKKYQHEKTINLIHGNSAEQMPILLNKINERCLFWLDGHYSGGNTAGENIPSPLYKELEAIQNHAIKNHIILIDDIRAEDIFMLQQALLRINPEYKFYFEDSIVDENLTFHQDILIATI